MICAPHPILFGDKLKKNEMGREFSAYEEQERHIQGFGWET